MDPKNNYAFQKIFGTEKNKDILIHFLNDVLIFKHHKPIVEVTFLKTIQDPEIAAQKTSIVDILCKDEVGHTYVVEIDQLGQVFYVINTILRGSNPSPSSYKFT